MINPVGISSCSSSKRNPTGVKSSVPSSSWIPSLNVPVCSWTIFWVLSNSFNINSLVVVSQAITVPTWEVKELFAPNVPVTSLSKKCALKLTSGGFVLLYLNPLLLIFKLCIFPISWGVAKIAAPEPPTLVIDSVGNLL